MNLRDIEKKYSMRITSDPPFFIGMIDIEKLIKEQRLEDANAIHIEYEHNRKELLKYYRKYYD